MTPLAAEMIPLGFLTFFAAIWLGANSLLGWQSGWFRLQRAFPDRDEEALVTLRRRSGSFGNLAYSGVLTLSACPSGLRVAVSRLFGPFQRPFFVPWAKIDAKPTTLLFVPMIKLQLGKPEIGRLSLFGPTWQRLGEAGLKARFDPTILPSRSAIGRGFLLQWLIMSLLAGCFFAVALSSGPNPAPLPIVAVLSVVPGVFFGIFFGISFILQNQ